MSRLAQNISPLHRRRGFRRHMPVEKLILAYNMRRNPTASEAVLWSKLKEKQLGIRARRQAPMLGYIADFYFAQAKLVVELDGAFHADRLEYDRHRDAVLRRHGFETLRIPSSLVFRNINLVLGLIRSTIARRLSRNSQASSRKRNDASGPPCAVVPYL